MAEQFRFQESFGTRPAVDRDKGSAAPGTLIVDRFRRQFLPGPTLAGDQHREV